MFNGFGLTILFPMLWGCQMVKVGLGSGQVELLGKVCAVEAENQFHKLISGWWNLFFLSTYWIYFFEESQKNALL